MKIEIVCEPRIVSQQIEKEAVFKVNGKDIRVLWSYSENDHNMSGDIDIDEDGYELLTEEELDELQDYTYKYDWNKGGN